MAYAPPLGGSVAFVAPAGTYDSLPNGGSVGFYEGAVGYAEEAIVLILAGFGGIPNLGVVERRIEVDALCVAEFPFSGLLSSEIQLLCASTGIGHITSYLAGALELEADATGFIAPSGLTQEILSFTCGSYGGVPIYGVTLCELPIAALTIGVCVASGSATNNLELSVVSVGTCHPTGLVAGAVVAQLSATAKSGASSVCSAAIQVSGLVAVSHGRTGTVSAEMGVGSSANASHGISGAALTPLPLEAKGASVFVKAVIGDVFSAIQPGLVARGDARTYGVEPDALFVRTRSNKVIVREAA